MEIRRDVARYVSAGSEASLAGLLVRTGRALPGSRKPTAASKFPIPFRNQLHSARFARMIFPRWRRLPPSAPNRAARKELRNHELQDKIFSRNTHSCSHVRAFLRHSKGRPHSRCAAGSIPTDRRRLVNLCVALREIEIEHEQETIRFGSCCEMLTDSVYDFPIRTPVMKTSTPPKPTCSAAETQGVSM
jgi:hypothetical protein